MSLQIWEGLADTPDTNPLAPLTIIELGVNVQAWDANLDQVAVLIPTNGAFIVGNGSAWTNRALLASDIPTLTSAKLSDFATAADARVSAAVGSTVQAHDSDLDALAALAPADGTFVKRAGGVWTASILGAGDIPSLDAAIIGSGTLATARTDYTPAIILAPGSSTRNIIQPSGDFQTLILRANAAQVAGNAVLTVQDSTPTNVMTVNKNGMLDTLGLRISSVLGSTSYIGFDSATLTKVTSGTTLGIVSQISTRSGSAAFGAEGVSGRPFNIGLTNGVELGVVLTTLASAIPLVVRGAALQSVNLQEWQDSTPTTVASIDKNGSAIFTGTGNGASTPVVAACQNVFPFNATSALRFYVKADAIGSTLAFNGVPTFDSSCTMTGLTKDYPSGTPGRSAWALDTDSTDTFYIRNKNSANNVFSTPFSLTVTGLLTNKALDAVTAAVTNVLVLDHSSSGTPAASYGTGLLFQGQSSTTASRSMARIRSAWTTATDASRVANMVLSVFNTAEVDVLKLSPTLISAADPTTAKDTMNLLYATGSFRAAGAIVLTTGIDGVKTMLDASRVTLDRESSDGYSAGRVTVYGSDSAAKVTLSGSTGITLADAFNLIVGATTGTKIGTVGGAAGQKLAFWGATPAVQPVFATGAVHTVDDLITVLQTLGLLRQA